MTPTEEAIYRAGVLAERDAYAPVLNAERLAWFNAIKICITASDVAIGPIHPPAKSNVLAFPVEGEPEIVGRWIL